MWIHHTINLSVVIVGLLTIAYLYIRRRYSYWSKKGVPFKKPQFFFGTFGDFVRKKTPLSKVVMDVYNGFKGERFGGVWELFRPLIFVVDPNLVRDILVKDFGTWPDRRRTVNFHVDPLEEHLASLDGKRWKAVRAKLTPTFTSAKLKHMHHLLLECGKDYEKYLDMVVKRREPVEAREMNAKFTTDIIGSCVFGIQMNSLNDEDAIFRKMGKKMFESSTKKQIIMLLQTNFPWLFKLLNLSTTAPEVTEFFLKFIKESFEYREKNNVQRHDFIDLLRGLKNTGQPLGEDEVEFSDSLLAAQAFVFFGGGFETSSMTISYCLHELAVNKNIQDRLREEVHRTKAANDGEITWNGLQDMKYLDMVLRETLRKYPIVPQIQRMAVRSYRIPDTNVELPSGIKAIIPIFALHHDPEYFPDPETFDPERFTEKAKSQRPAFAYVPFGGGPRSCIGSRFAEQQTKMALVKVVDNFEVSLCEKSQNPLQFQCGSPLLHPKFGIWLKITRSDLN